MLGEVVCLIRTRQWSACSNWVQGWPARRYSVRELREKVHTFLLHHAYLYNGVGLQEFLFRLRVFSCHLLHCYLRVEINATFLQYRTLWRWGIFWTFPGANVADLVPYVGTRWHWRCMSNDSFAYCYTLSLWMITFFSCLFLWLCFASYIWNMQKVLLLFLCKTLF
jgi:hypothetical protein